VSQFYSARAEEEPEGLGGAVEAVDPSLDGNSAGSLDRVFRLAPTDFDARFFQPYGLEYLGTHFRSHGFELRVVSHPRATTTCFEKAELLGWDPLNVIKALYFEDQVTHRLFAVVVPETGCFVDMARIGRIAGITEPGRLRKSSTFPRNMERGTCSPFLTEADLVAAGGLVERIWFDTGSLLGKRNGGLLDDFSFGLDHRFSVQLGYAHAYDLLRARYPGVITDAEILSLSFKQVMARVKGKIKLRYEFESLNYRTAAFFSSMHGARDVTISNDYVDELDLPDPLKQC
jgi:hypothetical protein